MRWVHGYGHAKRRRAISAFGVRRRAVPMVRIALPPTTRDQMQMLDIYTHIFPDAFFAEMNKVSSDLGNIGKRLRGIVPLFDLDVRFRAMDMVGDGDGYQQAISLPHPPIEDVATGPVAARLAQVANDAMA